MTTLRTPTRQLFIPKTRRERGQMLAIVALLITALIGFVGLVIDTGHFYAQRRQSQNAADEAATAGAREQFYGGSVGAATTAALNNASGNGFNNNGTSNTVTVHIPPTSGPHAGDSNFVEVTVWQQPKTFFIQVLGIGGSVRSRGVAGYVPVPKPYALVVLDPTKCSAYYQSGGGTLSIVGGGAMVDSDGSNGSGSNCPSSGSQDGGSTLNSDLYINYYYQGSWDLSNNSSASPTPSAVPRRIDDPLASWVRPVPCEASGTNPAGCIRRSPDSSGTANNPSQTLINASSRTTTLHPGTYYGGIKFTGGPDMTMLPGLYVMAGGGFDYESTSKVTGSGVTIYNTFDPYHNSGQGVCNSISLQGSGTFDLTANTSGTYPNTSGTYPPNMLFWQDPACTNRFNYLGSNNQTTSGIIYLPTAQLNISGGGELGALQMIVDSFAFSSNQHVTIDYRNYVNIYEPRVALVE